MKLKDKLKVSFCVMVILPALLLCVFVVGIFKIQSDSICKTYNVEDDTVLLYFYSPMTLFGSITDDVYEQIKEQAEEEPTTFNNRAYLESLGSTLNDRLSELVVRKNNNVIYNSTQYSNTDLARLLPEYETDENNITDVATYRGGIYHSLIKQVDFSDSLGNIYSVSIVTSVKQSIPQIRQMLWQLVFIIIIILVITSLVLNLWIYSSIIKPVNKLKLATDNIKEGNFDFEMPRVPDNEIGDVEGLRDGIADTPEKQAKYIKTISNKVNDMDKLIDELTIYSRLDANRILYTFIKLNVSDYFDDCCEEIGTELDASGIELNYRNHIDKPVMIVADPEQLKRVIKII